MLPLILSFLGSGAAGAGLLGTGLLASPLVAGAIGTGLGTAIETGDLGKGLQAGLLGGLGGAALGSLMGGGSTTAMQAAQGAPAAAGATGAATGVATGATAGTMLTPPPPPPPSAGGGMLNMFKNMPSGMNPGTALPAGSPPLDVLKQGVQQGAMTRAGLGAALTPGLVAPNLLMPEPKKPKKYRRPQAAPHERERYSPGADYQPGADEEFLYFDPYPIGSSYAEGGLVDEPPRAPIAPGTLMPGMPEGFFDAGYRRAAYGLDNTTGMESATFRALGRMASEGKLPGSMFGDVPSPAEYAEFLNPTPPADGTDAGLATLLQARATEPKKSDRRLNRTVNRKAGGGVIQMQEGGIADMPQGDAAFPRVPEAPEAPRMNERELVSLTIKAVREELPEEQSAIVLAQFVQTYGEDALRKLVTDVSEGRVQGGDMEGQIRGPGDGMDDLVPAQMDDGGTDVLLSDGEFIVPADVVSGLGNGSTDAGAAELEDMMSRVRKERTGMTQQPKQVAAGGLLPA